MSVWLGLGGGPTTVNIMAVTYFHCIMNPLLLTIDMFDLVVVFMFSFLIVCYNFDCIGYQFAAMMPFTPMRHHKSHDLS